MGKIKSWFTIENVMTVFVVTGLIIASVAFVALLLTAPTVYDRIEDCVAMEVYTRAECVVIESSR